ncbi:MAG TPA: methyltransferase domain-containing protein [candidate division Zixibacteria bacterium]|nr:methyltransferase domain-containing protein [candidate division Zixibacteria bacterium]
MLDQSGFEKWAGNYDESLARCLDSFPFRGYYDVLAEVVARVEPEQGMKVMDVGIGTGLLSEELARRGCVVYGVDFSTRMLEKAQARVSSGRFDAVDVTRDHFGKFNDQRFDRIVSSYFLHHLDLDRQMIFIQRTLRDNLNPGGRIIIADIGFANEKDFEAGQTKYEAEWDDDEFYLCGESIVGRLRREGIAARYAQVSDCAGILVCE